MPEAAVYESQLSREAVAFVVGLSKKQQRLVLDLADQIARQPFRKCGAGRIAFLRRDGR